MIINELYKPILDSGTIGLVLQNKLKIKDAMILTLGGCTILTQGLIGCDLVNTIDTIYKQDNGVLRLYKSSDVLEDEYNNEYYLPVNGGEYYTDMINFVAYPAKY